MIRTCSVLLALLLLAGPVRAEKPELLKAGIIGLDTSHVVAFTAMLNKDNTGPLENIRVVAAFPAGSPDIDISANRIKGFTNTLRDKYKVEIVDSIEALLKKVDVVLLESVDGRPHLKQAIPVFKAGKPVFIDKPIAASLADTIEIFDLAKKYKTPCFSSSSMRYMDSLKKLSQDPAIGKVQRCDTTGPVNPLKGHPDLFFYGIHGIEMVYKVLGPGCEKVSWKGKDEPVVGVWKDGRIGTFRNAKGYTAKITGDKGTVEGKISGGYDGLVREICTFFRTKKAPVSSAETIELVAFMTAAEESKKAGGKEVTIDSVMKQVRKKITEGKK
jgi:predicted dehydrogenase